MTRAIPTQGCPAQVEAARAVRDALPLSATAVRAAVPCGAAAGQLCEWVMAMLGGIRRTSTSDVKRPAPGRRGVTWLVPPDPIRQNLRIPPFKVGGCSIQMRRVFLIKSLH